jgi:hypothetical protein
MALVKVGDTSVFASQHTQYKKQHFTPFRPFPFLSAVTMFRNFYCHACLPNSLGVLRPSSLFQD